jgi:hypothetical protein
LKQLAEAARDEQDPKKLMNLIDQLNHALSKHVKGLYPRPRRASQLAPFTLPQNQLVRRLQGLSSGLSRDVAQRTSVWQPLSSLHVKSFT